jgi:hypothetical protein
MNHDSYSDDDESDDLDDDRMMPGILSEGESYHIKRVLVQGWVHKKGTGKDWIGSRAWKPRWASLALARIAGYDADVPLLLIFWNIKAPIPSTVLILDSTIVLPDDDSDKLKWNCYRFKIRHVRETEDSSVPATRTFSCPQEGRNAWVFAINQALLEYEKEKAKARKAANAVLNSSAGSLSMAWKLDSIHCTAIKSKIRENFASPPSSPSSSPGKRPMTRPNSRSPK